MDPAVQLVKEHLPQEQDRLPEAEPAIKKELDTEETPDIKENPEEDIHGFAI